MKNGFTLVELLAVMIIMGLLLVITVPAYTEVYSGIRRNNLTGKLNEIDSAAYKYGEKIKDEVKNAGSSCENITVATLIEKGYLMSDIESEPVILNPTTNEPLDGVIKICYCLNQYDIKTYYTKPFIINNIYYPGDFVTYNDGNGEKIYECLRKYDKGTGIHSTVIEHNKQYNYFKEVTQDNC